MAPNRSLNGVQRVQRHTQSHLSLYFLPVPRPVAMRWPNKFLTQQFRHPDTTRTTRNHPEHRHLHRAHRGANCTMARPSGGAAAATTTASVLGQQWLQKACERATECVRTLCVRRAEEVLANRGHLLCHHLWGGQVERRMCWSNSCPEVPLFVPPFSIGDCAYFGQGSYVGVAPECSSFERPILMV